MSGTSKLDWFFRLIRVSSEQFRPRQVGLIRAMECKTHLFTFFLVYFSIPINSASSSHLESDVSHLSNNLSRRGLKIGNLIIPSTSQAAESEDFQVTQKGVRKILPKGPLPQDIPTQYSALAFQKSHVRIFFIWNFHEFHLKTKDLSRLILLFQWHWEPLVMTVEWK